MKWAKERDSLIAQTKAFVSSVIAWRADNAPPPDSVQPVAIENPFAVRLREELEQIESVERLDAEEAAEPAQALPMAELPPLRSAQSEPTSPDPASPDVPSLTPPSVSGAPQEPDTPQNADTPQKEDPAVQNDIRKEIQSRVAAFQAHQHRFAREREAYFNSVLTKARSALDGKNGDGDHDQPPA